MTALISHPFRFLANGNVAVREDSTDEYLAERLALVISIKPGERPLVPLFGINDPAFDGLPVSALQVQANIFKIPVSIRNVTTKVVSDELTDYVVEFTKQGEL